MSNFRALKISKKENKFGCCLFAELPPGKHESSDCFEYLKKIPTLIKPPKENIRQIFLAKKIPESITSNPKKSLDHPPLLETQSTPPGLSRVIENAGGEKETEDYSNTAPKRSHERRSKISKPFKAPSWGQYQRETCWCSNWMTSETSGSWLSQHFELLPHINDPSKYNRS